MNSPDTASLTALFSTLGAPAPVLSGGTLPVTAPQTGNLIAQLVVDTLTTLDGKVQGAKKAQTKLAVLSRQQRIALLHTIAAAIKEQRETLAAIISLEAGKLPKEALVEVDSSADTLIKTYADASLPDLLGMRRCKERPPVGVVGLITSFNFPLVVAHWTLAPALLAGNAVLWKPSEKTPLTALAFKALFDQALGEYADIVHILIGGREIGEALVAHEDIDMLCATGSVMMGKGIKRTLANKRNNSIKPILELGGNNGAIFTARTTPEHLAWSVGALLNSFLGTTGQRCTNTRRLMVHRSILEQTIALFEGRIAAFLANNSIARPESPATNEFGYSALIDHDAYQRFEHAKKAILAEGGTLRFGNRLYGPEWPNAYYIEPTLAIMPSPSPIMMEEVFAPLLFITPYDGELSQAIAMINAPDNAGLVNGIYTLSQHEANQFARENQAGHTVINSAKGTGTPAFGMGFGGNKASGEGEILNSADPLRPFTRDTHFYRIAQNTEIAMQE